MPSKKHETPLLLIRDKPDLVRHFCAQLGVAVPADCHAQLASEDATQVKPLANDRKVVFRNGSG